MASPISSRIALVLALGVASCGAPRASQARRSEPPAEVTADVAELEIRSEGVDRFTVCPPPGTLAQRWIPPISPWVPPPVGDAGALPIDEDFIVRTKDRTATELAVDATHHELRRCYLQGLIRHPNQDGRVAIVLRIGGDGRVAKVESYAACELAPESIRCMEGVARKLRFPPPAGGSDTVTIPATFTSREGVRRSASTPNDAYTADAYVTLDAARAALHACSAPPPVEARGTFTLDIAADGRVVKASLDPWKGDHPVLLCAARALETLRFTAPANGHGIVVARLNFNPRQGTR